MAGDLDLEVKEDKELLCSCHNICGIEYQVTNDVSLNRCMKNCGLFRYLYFAGRSDKSN